MKNSILLLPLVITLTACFGSKTHPKVQAVSAMKKVMIGVDLSNNIFWDTMNREHLFAVAPLGRLEGEVTVINGKMFVSQVDAKHSEHITTSWDVHSPFAVFSYIPSWRSIKKSVKISSEQDLEKLIENTAKQMRYDLNVPFAFRVKGHFDAVAYHIISKPLDEIEHNHELHIQAKKHFQLSHTPGELIGFYSQHHEGIFTHKGSFIHTHFLTGNQKHAGHLEDISIFGEIEIMLPQ